MNWEEIGKRIRKQREYLGYTREAFAEKLDVTPKFCSDIELGLKGISVTTLCNLCHVLMLSSDYILFGSTESKIDSPAVAMLQKCPPDKLADLERIIQVFMHAIEEI